MKPGKDYIGVGCGALILNDKDEALLIRRGPLAKNDVGFWNQPGGGVEFGEKVADAIVREIKEELDIEIELIRMLCFSEQILLDQGQHWFAVTWLAKIKSGEPKIVEVGKHDKLEWIPLDKMPEKLSSTTKDSVAAYSKSKK